MEYATGHIKLFNEDCLEAILRLPDDSIDSIVTDPPYGLSFMGKHWDYDVPSADIWKEALRVLKPGGYLLSFGGSRTYHRMACAIEDAGFEIRDQIMWIYGSGFPKSLNVGDGIGTALKPAHEPICMARKPIGEKTVAENVMKYGTGGINIDGCRIELNGQAKDKGNPNRIGNKAGNATTFDTSKEYDFTQGRFPANVIHDGSDEVVNEFPVLHGAGNKRDMNKNHNYNATSYRISSSKNPNYYQNNGGSAARFFYCAKASKSERNNGCEGLEEKKLDESRKEGNPGGDNPRNRGVNPQLNNHPTVKPIALMRYLCRLVTPDGGTVLDPFMGSGTTGIAAKIEGFSFIGIERETDYCNIARARIEAWKEEKVVMDTQQKLF